MEKFYANDWITLMIKLNRLYKEIQISVGVDVQFLQTFIHFVHFFNDCRKLRVQNTSFMRFNSFFHFHLLINWHQAQTFGTRRTFYLDIFTLIIYVETKHKMQDMAEYAHIHGQSNWWWCVVCDVYATIFSRPFFNCTFDQWIWEKRNHS